MRLREVFFDAGGTLLHVRPSVGHVYAEAVARLGHAVEPEEVNRAFNGAWKRSLERRRAAGYLATDASLRGEWRTIVAETLDGRVPPEIARRAFEHLYEHFAGPEPWSLAEGAVETLEALRRAGLRLGVLSNWDSRLRITLEKVGVLELFDDLVVSNEVGVEKPHPEIFRVAERRAGAAPGALLMVGDCLDQDVLPALGLGWNALLFCPGRPPERPVEHAESFTGVLERVRALLGT